MTYRWFVGVDVSKAKLDVCLFDAQENKRHSFMATNTSSGHRQITDTLLRRKVDESQAIFCMENTGLYDDLLINHLCTNGWPVSLEKTTMLAKVRPEHHRKDDRFDAELIAEYAFRYQDRLKHHVPDNPIIAELRLLYRERRRMVTQRATLTKLLSEASMTSYPSKTVVALWQRQRAFYSSEIDRLERQTTELVSADPLVQRRFNQMRKINGFGDKMALLWVILFFGESRLNPRRIASRFGFAPHSNQSGTKKGPDRSTGHGNSEVRKMMTLCARSVGTHCPKYADYKQMKLNQGKHSRLVSNNIANKLIRVACAVWNQDGEFDPNYRSPFQTMTSTA